MTKRRLGSHEQEGAGIPRVISLVALSVVLLAACGEPAAVTTTGPGASGTSTSSVDPTTERLRELAFSYWEAFNAYDADLVLSYLEESYRATRHRLIRDEIDTISAFGVQLGIREESPPVVLSDGTAEMFMELKEPLGTRRIRMAFSRIEADWIIVFAEEVG
ncbi:MAG: hypothetical protein RI637_04170 [Acidimicrobiia bacterium]|nr:hypothetical protein [Acidimicrobiia bacterium]